MIPLISCESNSNYLKSENSVALSNSISLPSFENSSRTQESNWRDRAINVLNGVDNRLNRWMPNWTLQIKIDELGRYIEDKFSCFGEVDQWLRSNGQGAWYFQLATYLVKLPLRAAHNVIHLLYEIVKGAFQAVVHPLESPIRLAKMIIALLYAITLPGTYCKIGAGMIGAGLGQALILDIPVSTIAMIIGGAFLVSGLSFGALKEAIAAEQGKKGSAIFDFFGTQLKQLPESCLTGFFMGLLIGGIRKAMLPQQKLQGNALVRTQAEAESYAAEFVKNHHFPSPYSIQLDSSGNVILRFDFEAINRFYIPPEGDSIVSDLKIVLTPDGGGHAVVDWYYPWYGDDNHSLIRYSLEQIRVQP